MCLLHTCTVDPDQRSVCETQFIPAVCYIILFFCLSVSTSSPTLPAPKLEIYLRSEDSVVVVCRAPEGHLGVLFMLYQYREKVFVSLCAFRLVFFYRCANLFFVFLFIYRGGLSGAAVWCWGSPIHCESTGTRFSPTWTLLLSVQEPGGSLQCLQSIFAARATKRCLYYLIVNLLHTLHGCIKKKKKNRITHIIILINRKRQVTGLIEEKEERGCGLGYSSTYC